MSSLLVHILLRVYIASWKSGGVVVLPSALCIDSILVPAEENACFTHRLCINHIAIGRIEKVAINIWSCRRRCGVPMYGDMRYMISHSSWAVQEIRGTFDMQYEDWGYSDPTIRRVGPGRNNSPSCLQRETGRRPENEKASRVRFDRTTLT